jgi:hypothetical protein
VNEQLRDRIARRLEALSDERGLQILDYVEFLESKYAERSTPTNIFARLTDTVQDTMRAGKLPLEAISGTVGFFDGASKVMRGIASAATAVVDEAGKTAEQLAKAGAKPPSAPPPAPAPPPADAPG